MQAVSHVADRRPRLVLIEGPAGIGKTSLLEDLRVLGVEAGMTVRWSRGTVLEQTLAWSVVRQLLTQPVLDLTAKQRGRSLGPAAARATSVLGLVPDGARPLQLSEALHALYWLTVELSERRPLLLIVDDVQWVDSASIAYLDYLGNRLEDQPVLLAVAIRSGDPQSQSRELDELRLIPDQVTLSPRPLSRTASDEIVGRLLGDRGTPDVRQRFYHLTAGNPLLLNELCRGFDPGRCAYEDALERAEMTAAQGVSTSVLARLARHPALAGEVAQAAAILGSSATVHRLSRLTGASNTDVAESIERLIEAEILEQRNHVVDFVHPLVRRTVYEHLGECRRQVMHAQAAKLLLGEDVPAGEVGLQLLHAMPAGEPWRVAKLREAAAKTLAVGAPKAASTYLRRALIEPPRQEDAYELLIELGMSELHHDPRAAVDHFSQAHELADAINARSEAALCVARAHSLLGDFSSALSALNRAVDELGEADSPRRRPLDSARLVYARWDYASQELRDELFSDLRGRVDGGAELDRDEQANLAHELTARGEDLERAANCARSAIRNSATVSGTDAASVLQLTSVLVMCDLFDEAEETVLSAASDAESRGSAVDTCAALTLATWCALRRGDLAKAVERARSALALATGVWDMGAVAWLSEALAERGETAAAKALMRQHGFDKLSLTQTGETALGYEVAVLLHHRGRMRALAGDLTQALEDFLHVGELANGWRIKNPAGLDWRSSASALLLTLDRRDEAAELAAEELRLARRWGAASPVGTALRAVGMVDPSSSGTDLLRQAVELHATAPARLEHARSLVSLGVRLRRQRQQLEARELLRNGLHLASRCGAVLLAQQARDELVAAGGRPRRDAIQGAGALTGRERRIAELAVGELTNREIAQALFVSPRTVEHHLGNIYRKLGIHGRDKLADALD